MSGMINPDDFSNPDSLLDHIIDHIVKPQLDETCEGDTEGNEHSGVAWVFGCREPIHPGNFDQLQLRLTEGMSLDYALAEFSDLKIVTQRSRQHGQIDVRYIELAMREEDDEIAIPSVEELNAQFDL